MAIVVSHLGSDFDELAARALRQVPLSDLVELRLDRIGNPGEERLARFVRACKKPVIVTVHGPEAFGDFAGDVDERLDILRAAARAGARFVDVDHRLSLDLGTLEGRCVRIVSRHETEGTPQDLEALHEEVRAVLHEGDVTKIVTHAASTEDGLRLLNHLRSQPGLVAFCSGEPGRFTRVLAPIFGSAFTYCAPADLPGLGGGEPTAPGQIRVNDLLALLPPGGLSMETAVFGVVGSHVRHSFSPRVQGMALKAARLDAVYLAFETGDLDAFLELADDPCFRGFSVTMPHKVAALRRARSAERGAQAVGAANTLVRESQGWRALNTDVPAVRETLEKALVLHGRVPGRPASLVGARVLVLGAGGAAAAVLQAAREGGARASVAARDPARAAELARRLSAEAIEWGGIQHHEHDVLVNTTPVGSAGDPGRAPIPAEWIRPGTVVLDAVYHPVKTPLLAAALARGSTAVPGGEWFVRQARAQFRLFTGQEPDEDLMRAAFEHALGGA